MRIRTIQEADAEAFLWLRKQIARETTFLLHRPDEIVFTIAQQREQIQKLFLPEHHLLLVIEDEQSLVGYLMGIRGKLQKTLHVLSFSIGILQSYTHQGLGTRLLINMEQWARKQHIRRLELHVHENNPIAIALYKKQGFRTEGIMVDAICVDTDYINEYFMAKILR